MKPRRVLPRVWPIAAAVVTTVLVAAPAASADFEFFKSPSGNIYCVISGLQARCDIKQREWEVPEPPSACDFDYGPGVSVGRSGKAGFVCASDSVFSADAAALPYGESISKGRFRCVSKQTKMKCVNERNDRGFKLSKQSYKFLN